MTKEEKILGAVSAAGLALYFITRPKKAEPYGTEGASMPPPPKGPFPGISLANDAAICQQWKTGNARLPWGTVQWEKVSAAVDLGISKYLVQAPETLADAKELTFYITKYAVKRLCPDLDTPSTPAGLQLIRDTMPFWYRDLWDRVQTMAWDRVQASLGGSA